MLSRFGKKKELNIETIEPLEEEAPPEEFEIKNVSYEQNPLEKVLAYSKIANLVMAVITVIAIASTIVIYNGKNYFLIDLNDQTYTLVTTEADLTVDAMYSRADDIITQIFTYSYQTLEGHSNRFYNHVTPAGIEMLNRDFKDKGWLSLAMKNKLDMITTPTPTVRDYYATQDGVVAYRSYAQRVISGNKRKTMEVVYEIELAFTNSGRYKNGLKLNSVKEITMNEYNKMSGGI